MNACTNTLAQTGFEGITSPSWRQKLERLVAAWKLGQTARADQQIDDHFRREREAHEHYLARAGDRYELERLERDWDRRHADFWRVF